MLLRRTYMLFPGRQSAEKAVADLGDLGVDQRHVHTIAKQGVDISGLPKATVRQRTDLAGRIDQWVWDINLMIFFFALALLVLALWNGNWGWAIAGVAVMAVTFFAGNYFAQHVPHAHMTECQTALRHGEILLLVDVPRWRQATIEKAVRNRHPEVEIGGVGWTLDALGI